MSWKITASFPELSLSSRNDVLYITQVSKVAFILDPSP